MKLNKDMPKNNKEFTELVGDSAFLLRFIKKDTSHRAMAATMSLTKHVPEEDWPKNTPTTPFATRVNVYDLAKRSWRTVILENIIDLEILPGI